MRRNGKSLGSMPGNESSGTVCYKACNRERGKERQREREEPEGKIAFINVENTRKNLRRSIRVFTDHASNVFSRYVRLTYIFFSISFFFFGEEMERKRGIFS